MADSLEQMLKEADRAAGSPPAVEGSLAAQVRRVAGTRRRVRGIAVAAALLISVGVAALFSPLSQRPIARVIPSALPAAEVGRIQREIKALDAEVNYASRVVDRLSELERQRRLTDARRPASRGPDVLARLQEEQDRAAMLVVYEANRIIANPGRRQAAMSEYQRVVELFPKSCWAEVARQKMAELKG